MKKPLETGALVPKSKITKKTLLDKIDEISREIEHSSRYKAKPVQQSNEWIQRELFIYQPATFYHNGITHIRSIIKTIKKVEHTNHKTGEITNSTRVYFCIANFNESAEFFHYRILDHWKVDEVPLEGKRCINIKIMLSWKIAIVHT